ncbi:hypothetical protein AMTRI_Chr02g212310 [Amborella trichopoda]
MASPLAALSLSLSLSLSSNRDRVNTHSSLYIGTARAKLNLWVPAPTLALCS